MSKSRWGVKDYNTVLMIWPQHQWCLLQMFSFWWDILVLIITAKAKSKTWNAVWKLTVYITWKNLRMWINLKRAININNFTFVLLLVQQIIRLSFPPTFFIGNMWIYSDSETHSIECGPSQRGVWPFPTSYVQRAGELYNN